MKQLLSILLLLCSVAAMAVDGTAGPYRVELRTDPAVPQVGRVRLLLHLADAGGTPAAKATVKTFAQMPSMPMGERESVASPLATPGDYSAPAVLGMAGAYDVRIAISGPDGAGTTTLHIATGQDPATSGTGSPVAPIAIGLFVLGAAVLVWRSSRRHMTKGVLLQVIGAVLLIGVCLTVSIWAVNTYRRPGSMTPLEAQTMDMNAPAPEGALPVNLATGESKRFEPTVTYTGQAVGLVDDDIVARVSGAIVSMPVYVGDRVTKGQVLARLDTSQIDPMVSEKSAQSSAASQGVGIAESDYRKALADVQQAQAEQAMREGAVAESKAMIEASKQEQAGAEASLRMEQASVRDAQSQVDAAKADQDYWVQELARSKQLFAKGALSRDEYQKAEASAFSAAAHFRQAQAGVDVARARVLAARSAIAKAGSEVTAGESRLHEAQAEHHVHMAHVTSAQAAAESAKKRIDQAGAEMRMARAGLEGAATQRGYAELKSEIDGVVTSRVVSPGVVIAAGQTVLKVSQVSPVRLQANVPEADLVRVRVGASVRIMSRDGNQPEIEAKVTSVSPSVDPVSRTGIVEAIVDNRARRFLPGQYVTMQIAVGTASESVQVPCDAIESEEDADYVWVAEPAVDNTFTVSRRLVSLGGREGDRVAILSGIAAGVQVVRNPPQGLAAGMTVTSVAKPAVTAAGAYDQSVEITAAGYNPPSISIPAGKAFKVTFTRRDDKTCGTEVIFPTLGIRKALPLNQPVTVEIPPQPAGTHLNFTCPMNMLNGTAVAK
ncbi:MAG: efflux RND transporter periplasmic adaptor subunit [Fimbriimonas sp.]|nr:efflux RND transporter periplasmic adaptor subunit [Fimbriimonas sp.]